MPCVVLGRYRRYDRAAIGAWLEDCTNPDEGSGSSGVMSTGGHFQWRSRETSFARRGLSSELTSADSAPRSVEAPFPSSTSLWRPARSRAWPNVSGGSGYRPRLRGPVRPRRTCERGTPLVRPRCPPRAAAGAVAVPTQVSASRAGTRAAAEQTYCIGRVAGRRAG